MIIHVDGIPGAGKTYICSQLKDVENIMCLDVDKIVEDAYIKCREENSKHFIDQIHNDTFPYVWDRETILLKQKYTELAADENKILVWVGIDASAEADYGFYIKLQDLEKTYRRYAKRDMTKIFNNKSDILKIIDDTEDPYFIKYDIQLMAILSLFTYSDYIENYNLGIQKAKVKDYTIETQDIIIEKIKKLAKDPQSA